MKRWVLLILVFFSFSSFANLPYKPVKFPRDEAAHYDFMPYDYSQLKEWWYFNGKLKTTDGQTLGYDVAFFNSAHKKENRKKLIQYYHLQVADAKLKKTYGSRTLIPDAKAHVSTQELAILWKNDFRLEKQKENGVEVYHLLARGSEGDKKITIDLKMEPLANPFLINRIGLVPMPENTNSYYYTIPKLKTSGSIQVGEVVYQIDEMASESWMDHQWGDFKVEHYGWEWFSVRLDNGLVANLFLNMHAKSNKIVGGLANIIMPDGRKKYISHKDIKVSRKNYWQDPVLGLSYPLTYEITIPSLDLTFTTKAIYPEQEKHGYWEGLCNVTGFLGDDRVEGYSYNELVYLG